MTVHDAANFARASTDAAARLEARAFRLGFHSLHSHEVDPAAVAAGKLPKQTSSATQRARALLRDTATAGAVDTAASASASAAARLAEIKRRREREETMWALQQAVERGRAGLPATLLLTEEAFGDFDFDDDSVRKSHDAPASAGPWFPSTAVDDEFEFGSSADDVHVHGVHYHGGRRGHVKRTRIRYT